MRWLASRDIMKVTTRVDVGLIGDRLQLKHQRGVFLERFRDPLRRVHRDLDGAGLLLPYALMRLLNFADMVEIVVQASSVARAEFRPSCEPASPVTLSRMLRSSAWRARRCSLDPARPNMRSKATRGLISMGTGVVGDVQHNVFM